MSSPEVIRFETNCKGCGKGVFRPLPNCREHVERARNGMRVRCKECRQINFIPKAESNIE